MSADTAVQKAIRARLSGSLAVTTLLPAANIMDRHTRPAPSPSIIIGEGQSLEGNRINRSDQRVILDLHVWKQETSMEGVKAIAGAVRSSIHPQRLPSRTEFHPILPALSLDFINDEGVATSQAYHFGDCRVTSTRYLRDPGGEYSHAVITIETHVVEIA